MKPGDPAEDCIPCENTEATSLAEAIRILEQVGELYMF